jgi:hypothetical protein
MELYGYDRSESAYLERCFNESVPYRPAKPLALATIRPTDVTELRRIADFLNVMADSIESRAPVDENGRRFRTWDNTWRVGMADLVVAPPQ